MTQVRVDPDTSELVRVDGAFDRIDGKDEVGQHVRCKLRLIKGEVFLLKDKGVDWGFVFEKGNTLSEISSLFRKEIEETPGVASVADVVPTQDSIEKAQRLVNFTWEGTYSLPLLREEGPLYDSFVVRS